MFLFVFVVFVCRHDFPARGLRARGQLEAHVCGFEARLVAQNLLLGVFSLSWGFLMGFRGSLYRRFLAL